MASGIAHKCSSVLVAAIAFKLSPYNHHDLTMMIVASAAAAIGATAPDWMEIASVRRTVNGSFIRTSLIPHRTITHWAPAWLIALYISYVAMMNATSMNIYNYALLFAFSLGGVMHLILDLPNPTGIPITNPFKPYRIRFKKKYGLWRSGEYEWIMIPAMFALAGIILMVL